MTKYLSKTKALLLRGGWVNGRCWENEWGTIEKIKLKNECYVIVTESTKELRVFRSFVVRGRQLPIEKSPKKSADGKTGVYVWWDVKVENNLAAFVEREIIINIHMYTKKKREREREREIKVKLNKFEYEKKNNTLDI